MEPELRGGGGTVDKKGFNLYMMELKCRKKTLNQSLECDFNQSEEQRWDSIPNIMEGAVCL